MHFFGEAFETFELIQENHYEFLTNLSGRTINLVHYETEWVRGYVESGEFCGGGITELIIRDMQKNLNFQVNVTNLGDKDPSANDYFESGIGKFLQNGLADLAIEYMFLTIPRILVASPLHPNFMDGLFALFVQPPSSAVRNIYKEPLQPGVWLSWFLALFFVFFLCNIFIDREKTSQKLRNIPRLLTESIFTTIGSISQSGYVNPNIANVSTPVTLISSILSMSIYFVFAAQLLAFILRPTIPIQSLDDLLDNDYSFYTLPPFKRYFTQQSRLQLSRVNLGKFGSSDAWDNSLEAIFTERHARVDVGIDSAGGIVWNSRTTYMKKSPIEFCNLVSSIKILKSNFGVATAFYVSKHSRLRNVLNKSLLRIKEVGLMKRYLNHPSLPRLRCSPSIKSRYEENLGMDDVSFAFILFGVLVIFSQLSLLGEILWDWWKRLSFVCFKAKNLYYDFGEFINECCDVI